MANDTATIKIINLTPLPLQVAWPYARPAALGSFEHVDCSIPLQQVGSNGAIRAGKIDFMHDLPHGDRPTICTIDLDIIIAKGTLPSAITIDTAFVRDPPGAAGPGPKLEDFLDAYQRSGGQWPYQLQIINKTDRFVDAYLLGTKEEKGSEHWWGRLEPGQTSQFPAADLQLWQFRSPLSGEMIGMIKTRRGPDHSDSYTLTDEFRQGWLKYQHQSSTGRFSPVRVIGEQRSSTPERDDQTFITATTVRRDLSKDIFNGLKDRILRDVEIAGVLLRWSYSNRVLRDYYGEGAADIRSLTIYADRMEVSDHLRFPRTNVTIYARELAFTGIGCIDTTPLPYPARAVSEYLTKDPLDPTNSNAPADSDGNPTYTAADGTKGEPAGNITLYVRGLIDEPGNTSTKRLICRGGKGQAGEAGGLKAYVANDGYPGQYGPLAPINADKVRDFVQDKTWSVGKHCYDFRWPGEHGDVDWPDQIRGPDPGCNVLNTGHATAVTVLAYCDDAWATAGGFAAWGERYFLPSYDFEHWYNPQGAYGDRSEDTTPNPAPRPCNGRDAYCGGWPGDGGDGGVITATLASGQVPDIICDVDAGQPGDYTAYTPGGGPPGPTPAYTMRIVIVKKSAIASSRGPHVDVTEVSGKPGQNAPGRAYHGASAPPAPDGAQYEWRDTTAKVGQLTQRTVQREDLSWAHSTAVGAVLSYARTAYRNGYREEAAAALDPYFALIGGEPGKPPNSTGFQLAFASITAMRNNLVRNFDYYGNPPGWVPRLSALTNLDDLKSVRQAAYGTFYFADKMLSDYEALDDARAVSEDASTALEAELKTARATLQSAYDELPKAIGDLDQVQQDLVPVEQEINELHDRALEKTQDKIVAQRVFSAGMQLLGGIAESLPVGQPFVGLAGSALGSLSQFDWNAKEPLASAQSAVKELSQQVTSFVSNTQNQVSPFAANGLYDGSTQQPALATDLLTKQLGDEEDEPKENAKAAENHWTDFLEKENGNLKTQIDDTNTAIAAFQAAKNELEEAPANSFLKALQDQKAALDERRLATLGKGLVEYRKQQSYIEELSRKLTRTQNADLKKAVAATTSSDIPKDVQDKLNKLSDATQLSDDQKGRIAARELTATNVMASLQGIGNGLGMIGNGIVSLATPLTEDDPTWQRLADQMLLDDPELRAQGKALNQKLQEILGRKKKAANKLFFLQQQASTSAATIASNLGTLTALSRQRQSVDSGLDPTVQVYLQETKERAKDALAQSIYWFVKSFQYENLSDVDDTFYNFDTWTEKLRALEKDKQTPTEPGSQLTVGQDSTIVLAKEDFEKIGDEVFNAEQLNLGQGLLEKRQKRGAAFKDTYQGCILERKDSKTAEQLRTNQMLDNLKKEGAVTFNFIDDFEKGGYGMDDARVLDVDLKEFVIESSDPSLSLTIRVEHSGESIIGQRTGDGRVFYGFRSGPDDEPLCWQFVYNESVTDHQASKISKSLTVDTLQNQVKSLLPDLKDFSEYSPGLFSNYTIHITDYDDHKKDALKAINKVVLDVIISSA